MIACPWSQPMSLKPAASRAPTSIPPRRRWISWAPGSISPASRHWSRPNGTRFASVLAPSRNSNCPASTHARHCPSTRIPTMNPILGRWQHGSYAAGAHAKLTLLSPSAGLCLTSSALPACRHRGVDTHVDASVSDQFDTTVLAGEYLMNPGDRAGADPLAGAERPSALGEVTEHKAQRLEWAAGQCRRRGKADRPAVDFSLEHQPAGIGNQRTVEPRPDDEAAVIPEIGNHRHSSDLIDGCQRTRRELHPEMPLADELRGFRHRPLRLADRCIRARRHQQFGLDGGKAALNGGEINRTVRTR